MKEIKGFAFDLDGVIADTARFHTIAWRDVAEKVGTTWTPELQEGLKGIDRMGSLEMILEAGGKADAYSKEEKEALAEWKNTHYVELISDLTPEDILPGMMHFIEEVHEKGYKASIASVSKNAPFILDKLGLSGHFEGVVDPASLSNGKPDPEIFIRAAEVMGLPPENVIGIEDAAAGVASINGAGEISVGIGRADVLGGADILFEKTEEVTLAAILEKVEKL